MPSQRSFGVEALHTLALFALAIAQPLFSTIGAAPEFLVAHKAPPSVIIGLAVGLALALPLCIVAVEAMVSWIWRPAGKLVHAVVVLLLLLAIAVQVLERFFQLDLKVLLALALLAAVAASFLYWRSATISRMVSIAAVGALLLPLNFLFISPASKLVWAGEARGSGENTAAPKNNPPIVFIVFDEFNPTVLFDRNRQIDAARYPNIAALAADSWFFTKAVSPIHDTTFAIPAILTGKRPDPALPLPSYTDHPQNLFTLLGDSYELNVRETLTTLCPDWLCQQEKSFDARLMLADLAVVTGHTILPKAVASSYLPAMRDSWYGFNRGEGQTFLQKFNQHANRSRLHTIDDFIASTGARDGRLDFLHVLLPHTPYEFLPSGKSYNASRHSIGSEKLEGGDDVWGDNQDLINLDYQRYMLQVGLVDRKIGDLVTHLKVKGVYDETLIILVADHGRGFTSGQPIRAMSDKGAELLHVPLLIKRPGQSEGRISDITASTLDILPTIAHELGIDAPWEFAGTSLFAAEPPLRDQVALHWHGQDYQFDWEDIVALPLLAWQSDTFRSGERLAHLSIQNRYADLVGGASDAIGIPLGAEAPVARLSQNLSTTAAFDSDSSLLSLFIDSQIVGEVPEDSFLLVLVNGSVAAVSPVYQGQAGSPYVSVLLPPEIFEEGGNKIEAYLLADEAGQGVVMLPVEVEAESFRLEDDGKMLVSASGEAHRVANAPFGYVEHIALDAGALRLIGWSAATDTKQAVRLVVFISNGRFVCAASPSLERKDVVDYLGTADVLLSGFSTVCPINGDDFSEDRLTAIGISEGGVAGFLKQRK